MFEAEVWCLSPAGFIRATSENKALNLIAMSPGYENYIFFFAELAPPVEEVLP